MDSPPEQSLQALVESIQVGCGMKEEKRKIERYDLHIPTHVEVASDQNGPEELDVLTRDISAEGAFLLTDRAVAEGKTVKLEMTLQFEALAEHFGKHQPVRVLLEGTVLRRQEGGIAVRFGKNYRFVSEDRP